MRKGQSGLGQFAKCKFNMFSLPYMALMLQPPVYIIALKLNITHCVQHLYAYAVPGRGSMPLRRGLRYALKKGVIKPLMKGGLRHACAHYPPCVSMGMYIKCNIWPVIFQRPESLMTFHLNFIGVSQCRSKDKGFSKTMHEMSLHLAVGSTLGWVWTMCFPGAVTR